MTYNLRKDWRVVEIVFHHSKITAIKVLQHLYQKFETKNLKKKIGTKYLSIYYLYGQFQAKYRCKNLYNLNCPTQSQIAIKILQAKINGSVKRF